MGLFDKIFSGKKLETGLEKPNAQQPQAFGGKGAGSFFIKGVYEIAGVGVVAVGRVLAGTLLPGMTANIGGKIAVLKSMEVHHSVLKSAGAGMDISMNISGIAKSGLQPGMLLEFN